MIGQQAVWVGRVRELGLLDEVLERALDGRGSCALSTGEAGIGKTRLLEEVAEHARGRGFAVAWGRGWELGGAPSFWPWVELLRTLLARPFAPRVFGQRLEPLWVERGAGRALGKEDVFLSYDAVLSYLHAHAQLEPLALFIDDLHVVDPSSLTLAEFVARGLGGGRIALFGSLRVSEAGRGEQEQGLMRLGRASQAVALEPLTRTDVSTWMQHSIGHVDAEAEQRVHQASDGNPLFVRELLRLPDLEWKGPLGAPPPTLRALIRERVGSLGVSTLAALRAAALLGRQFSIPLLAQLTQQTSAELEAAAREAVTLGVLAALGTGQYRFSHGLMAETLVLDLDPVQRNGLHRRAAEMLEQRHASDPLPPVNEIARHWLAAGLDAAPRAALAAEHAACRSREGLAFADAAELYGHALEALASCSPLDVRRQGELYVGQIEAFSRAGRRESAEAVCSTAVELARALDDGSLLARSALALGAESQLGTADLTLARVLERALAALPPGDGALRAQVSARLASARQPELDPEPPMALAREAVAMARRLGDPALRLYVVHSAVGALMDFAPAEERAALNAEALELATRLLDSPRALAAAQRLAFDRIELGDVNGFERAVACHERVATEVAQPRYGWVPAMFHAMRADWQGDRARAEYWEGEARAIRDQGNAEGAALVPARRLSRALLYADPDLLDPFVAGLAAQSPEGSGTLWLSALLSAWRGESLAVRQALGTLAARGLGRFVGRVGLAASGPDAVGAPGTYRALAGPGATPAGMDPNHAVGLGYLHLLEVAVELACQLGDAAWADALHTELSSSAGKPFLLTTLGFSLHGVVDHALMRLSALSQRWELAHRHAVAAVDLCTRLGARAILARVYFDGAALALAERRQATRDAERARLLAAARAQIEQARAIARELGERALLERCARAEQQLVEPANTASVAEPEPRVVPPAPTLRLTLEGEYWTLSVPGALCRVRDSRGMQMLAQLVERPGRELHVLDLSGSALDAAGSDAGEVLDTRARAEYQARLRELRSEMDQAASFNDLGRHERLAHEAEALVQELSRGFGLGGRARRSGSLVERARVNVRRRLTLALRHIRAASPEIGDYLESHVRTGVHCVYTP